MLKMPVHDACPLLCRISWRSRQALKQEALLDGLLYPKATSKWLTTVCCASVFGFTVLIDAAKASPTIFITNDCGAVLARADASGKAGWQDASWKTSKTACAITWDQIKATEGPIVRVIVAFGECSGAIAAYEDLENTALVAFRSIAA
jgi:hypothetical protein